MNFAIVEISGIVRTENEVRSARYKAVHNPEIDGHVSTETSDFVKNQRYVNMSVKPDASTVKFVEYNNTGDGAIDTAVAGMRFR